MSTEQKIHDFIAQELLNTAETTIGYDEDLLMTGLVDSLGVMRLVAFVAETSGKEVPPLDVTLENFGTINQISTYISKT